MSIQKFPQVPLTLGAVRKGDVRSQFGALCYRMDGSKPEVLLVTSRGTGRWIVPKGWPMPGQTPAGTAAVEAYEEAGVEGDAHPQCLGIYSYTKVMDDTDDLPCVVSLFAIKVKRLLQKYPESDQRKRKWFSPKRAAALVDEDELRQIIRRFDPKVLTR
ncbi:MULTISPECIES: NUDIX hydrolase [unclassified Meridianimarinicoccus]|uniref:NUDIX hydrolase n=1 Tax=unclassified Meridianimarinicoccus TaxID=2923344 RepID=UPI001866B0AB|nr:NUDIX hydrolase [Fluviibacterium sp. MJW13]